jgi:hypothetical protein
MREKEKNIRKREYTWTEGLEIGAGLEIGMTGVLMISTKEMVNVIAGIGLIVCAVGLFLDGVRGVEGK